MITFWNALLKGLATMPKKEKRNEDHKKTA